MNTYKLNQKLKVAHDGDDRYIETATVVGVDRKGLYLVFAGDDPNGVGEFWTNAKLATCLRSD
jgi:hypothetical protein